VDKSHHMSQAEQDLYATVCC